MAQLDELGPEMALFTGEEAAKILRVKLCTVNNERKRRRLGFTRRGSRFLYSRQHIVDYLKRNEVKACNPSSQDPDRSESIGSPESRAEMQRATRYAARGTTRRDEERVLSALARQTFRKQRGCSPNG